MHEVLDNVYGKLETAKFTGKGDKDNVIKMLKDYEKQIFSFLKKERAAIAAELLQTTESAVDKKSLPPETASECT